MRLTRPAAALTLLAALLTTPAFARFVANTQLDETYAFQCAVEYRRAEQSARAPELFADYAEVRRMNRSEVLADFFGIRWDEVLMWADEPVSPSDPALRTLLDSPNPAARQPAADLLTFCDLHYHHQPVHVLRSSFSASFPPDEHLACASAYQALGKAHPDLHIPAKARAFQAAQGYRRAPSREYGAPLTEGEIQRAIDKRSQAAASGGAQQLRKQAAACDRAYGFAPLP